MTTFTVRPELPADVLVTSVNCVICRRFAKVGEFTIAPAASIYAGKPVCFRCIDLAPDLPRRAGPSETKELCPETPDGEWPAEFSNPPLVAIDEITFQL